MPRNVKPSVFLIARPQIDAAAVANWLATIGVSDEVIRTWVNRIYREKNFEAESLIELAGRRCYMSFQVGLNPNITKIRQDIADYIGNILKSRHGSVLEHANFTFAIEGVSRVFTGEMNRHRAGAAISEGSMRYIRYEDIPYWVPTRWQRDETPMTSRWTSLILDKTKEEASRSVLDRVFQFVELQYKTLTEIWKEELASPDPKDFHKKKELTSAMRRIIPMGVATGGMWTFNVRAIRHILETRGSAQAEEEILLVAVAMLDLMKRAEPTLFTDFQPDAKGFFVPEYSKV